MTDKNSIQVAASGDAWSLAKFPNYEKARDIESIDAKGLCQSDFVARYVMKNQPVCVRGAAAHWPAFQKWREPDYFKRATNNLMSEARHSPCSEFLAWAEEPVRLQLVKDIAANNRKMLFHDILDEMKGEGAQLVVDGCEFDQGSPLEAVSGDIGAFEFLRSSGKPRVNAPYRAFLYRGSYTDWHFHAADETLMTQVVGTKEVLVLPPDDVSWQALLPVIQERGYLFDTDVERYAGFGRLRPCRVVVEPGDALFIPVFWWHAVESVGKAFGVTVAKTFASPLHINGDWRYPALRKLARTYALTPFAPLLAAALGYAFLYKMSRGLRLAPPDPRFH